jgi:hypothetical protein
MPRNSTLDDPGKIFVQERLAACEDDDWRATFVDGLQAVLQ